MSCPLVYLLSVLIVAPFSSLSLFFFSCHSVEANKADEPEITRKKLTRKELNRLKKQKKKEKRQRKLEEEERIETEARKIQNKRKRKLESDESFEQPSKSMLLYDIIDCKRKGSTNHCEVLV